ncbi:MAG: helix-turn-helix transcriptional regulator [Actinobacteria bacterium]|nr:helix-turn-helix transcriptional regulator [Actinomycetota bacterium]
MEGAPSVTTRFFRHRELHLVLLALLAERPMHGYELMRELGERFGPAYRPSAGSVYPALDSLSSEDLIRPEQGSEPTSYLLTPVGEAALARRGGDLLRLERRTGVVLGTEAPVEAALARLAQTARTAARSINGDRVERLLAETAAQLEELNKKEIS